MSIRSMIAKTGSTCLIQSPTTTMDSMNSPVETWATVGTYTAEPVRLRQMTGDERNDADARIARSTHIAYFEGALTSVDETCRLTIGGVVYLVHRIDNWNLVSHHTRIWVEKIEVE